MPGDDLAAVPYLQPSVAPADLYRLPDERERHRVAIGVDTHQLVARHNACQRRLEPESPTGRCQHERRALPRKALDRALVRRPVHTHVGHRRIHSANCSLKSRSSPSLQVPPLLTWYGYVPYNEGT